MADEASSLTTNAASSSAGWSQEIVAGDVKSLVVDRSRLKVVSGLRGLVRVSFQTECAATLSDGYRFFFRLFVDRVGAAFVLLDSGGLLGGSFAFQRTFALDRQTAY